MTMLVAALSAAVLAGAGAMLLELALRRWINTRAPIHLRAPWTSFEITADPEVLPGLSPRISFTCNAFGARGGDVPVGGRTFKALAIGGSSVECFLLDDREVWTEVAADRLRRPDAIARLDADHVRIWNIGKSGVTTDTLVYALPDELARMPRLDVAIIMNGGSALLKWCEMGLPARLPPMQPSWVDIAFHRNVSWSWRPGGTALAECYRRLSAQRPGPARKLDRLGRSVAKARALRAGATNVIDTVPADADWLAHYERSLGRVIDVVRTRADHVLLIHQPIYQKSDPTAAEQAMFWHCAIGSADQPTGFLSHRLMIELNDELRRSTERVARARGTEFLDPSARMPSSPEAYYDHYHYKPEGSRRLGELVAERLLDIAAPRAAPRHDGTPSARKLERHAFTADRRDDGRPRSAT
ncbi:MAG: hypothetical protein SFW09_18840 [Hyphomicrobiaceae bacterium]|nr:hypothetical protein [Hyphomicrobiaceae bacterium]